MREALEHPWLADDAILAPGEYRTPGTYDPPDPSAVPLSKICYDVGGRTLEDILEPHLDQAAASQSLTLNLPEDEDY